MAINIISGNLGIAYNAGTFEGDPSTYDPPSIANGLGTYGIGRRSDLFYEGLNSGWVYNRGTGGIHVVYELISQKFNAVAGKKYVARIWFRTPQRPFDPTPIADETTVMSLDKKSGPIDLVEVVEEYAISNTHDDFVMLESYFIATGTGMALVQLKTSVPQIDLAFDCACNVDKFEVYEYEDVVPDPSTLAIDKPGSTITNASGPVATDGFIEVAITGGTGPFEYSNDNGGSWQLSNQFAGLAPDNYQVKVREIATPANVVSDIFSVPYDGADFDFTTDVTDESVAGAADGRIEMTVTGTGAPFTYAIQHPTLPAVYQSSNIFEGLSPNGYDVFVKDSGGNVVQHYALLAVGALVFDKIFWSKNPITFTKSAASDWAERTNYRLYADVRVEDEWGSGVYNSKLKIALPPDADGNVVFQVRQAFRGLFELTPPSLGVLGGFSTTITDNMKRFRIYTGEIEDTEIETDDLEASLTCLAIYGGLGKYAWPLFDFFGMQYPVGERYLATRKMFLTWAPVEKIVENDQEDWLTFFVYTTGVYSVKPKFTAYFDDATNTSVFIGSILAGSDMYGSMVQIASGPYNSGARNINPAKNLLYYTVQLFDQDDVAISELRTFILKPVSAPGKKYFMYVNAVGCWETLCFTGITEYESAISKTQTLKFLPHDYNALDGEKELNNATLQRSSNVSSGFLTGKYAADWMKYLDDFLMSPTVFDVTDRNARPVQVLGGSFGKGSENNYERFVRATVVDSYEDENYTPEIDL